MSWIKRNLSLVISGVAALALLGFGGWYLYSAIEKNNQIDGEINQIKSEIERLLNMDPTPNQQNLTLAKQEAAKLAAFVAEAKKQFPSTPPPSEPLNDLSFRSLLENTVNELHKQASSVGIKVSEDTNRHYYFTFEAQRTSMRFSPESLRPLSERLHEVRQMAEVLFRARVNRLVWMKRAMVPGERPQQPGANPGGGGPVPPDYLNVSARTNAEANMILWPYEVVFDCFSPELGTVLESLERMPGIIVKTIQTDVSPEAAAMVERRRAEAPPDMRRFPQGRPIPGGGVRTNVPAAPVPALTTVINERPLRVTMRIDVIKPEPQQPGGGGRGGRGGPP